MAVGQGFKSIAALGKQAVWATGVAVNEILPFTSEDVNKLFQRLENEYLDGEAGKRESQGDLVQVTGGINAQAIYDEKENQDSYRKGIDALIYLGLGAATFVAGTGVGSQMNQYTPADDIDVSWTIAFSKQVSVWELVGAKLGSLTIEGTIGEGVSLSGDIIARNLLRTGDAGIVNTASDISNVNGNFSAIIPVMLDLQHATFRVGTHGAALGDANKFKISQFSLSINNNLVTDQYATPASDHADSSFILEPKRNGKKEISFSITLPRYESNQFFSWLNADTPIQADLKFVDPVNSKQFNIYLPNLRVVTPAAAVPDASIFPLTVEFVALINGTVNTHMKFQNAAAITKEIGIETKSGRTAIP